MAQVHGRAGNYPSAQASRLLDRVVLVVISSELVLGGVAGFALAQWGVGAAGAVLVVAALVAWRSRTAIDRYVTTIRRERLSYARGADGEELVGALLEDLPRSWHVFHGMQLEATSDIDHIVVGPGGLYCISTKNYRGLLSADGDDLLYNGQPTSLARETTAQAMKVRERLTALMGGTLPWVEAVLAVPQAWVELQGSFHNVHVLHQDNLVRYIENAPQRLNGAQVTSCVKALELLAASAVDVRMRAAKAFPSTTAHRE